MQTLKVFNLRKLWLSLLLLVGATAIAIPGIQEVAATEEDVIEIGTVEQLKEFRDAVNSGTSYAGKTVKLTADLDLSSEANWKPIGNVAAYPGQAFRGVFDGNGKTISNLTSNDETANWSCAGLFGSISNGTIKDLTLTNVDIQSYHYAAGIVAYKGDDTNVSIQNCKVIGGTIKSTPELLSSGKYDNGDKAGGIMGYATAPSTIDNCWVENVTITAYRDLGGIVGCSNGTVTNNTAKNVTVTQDLTNGYETSTPTTIGDIVGRGSATNNVEANGNIVIKSNPVAQIGETKYETIAEAVAAANAGDVIEVIKAGDYTLPNISKNVTIEGAVDGVVFNHTTAGSVASIPNGATFKNVTFNFGNVNYHGFQHAGAINMEGCTLNGKLFSYGDMNFTDCSFNQSNSDYHMWTYSGNVTYTDCTFTNSVTGKFLNVYNESGATKYTVTVNNCKFVNNASAANKAALNVKATSGSNVLAYDVIINNCTTEGAFPEANWGDALVVLNNLAQVDDRTASGVDIITVTQDGTLIYPNYVAAIGDTKYTTLQGAFNAAETGQTVTLLKDYDAKNEAMAGGTRQFVIKKSITFDGGGYTLTTKQRGIGVGNVNGDVAANIDVTIKNVTVLNTSDGARCIDTRGMIGSLTLEGVTLSTDGAPSGYTQPLTIGGNQTDAATVTITNSTIQTNDDATAYYAIITFNPVNMNITNSTIKGWANIFAKGKDGSAGSASSVFNIDQCTLVSTNEYSGESNAFGAFVIGDNNVTINVTNSDIQINNTGDQWQTIVSDQNNTYTEGGVNLGEGNTITLSGQSAFAYAGNNLAVSGGVSNVPVPEEFCAEGMIPTANTDAATKEAYPYTVLELPDVAQIGDVKYKSLQKALDAAHEMTGDVTITLIDDITGYSIVHQKAGLNLTIDGADKTVAGQIIIDGDGRADTEGALETLTIQNIKFEGNTSNFYTGTDAFVLVPSTKTSGTPYYTNKYNYAHNITVTDCSFTSTSTSEEYDVVGFKATSNAGAYNVVINNCTASGTMMHSLAQFTGTTGGAVTNCTVTGSESFVNVNGGAGDFTISGNTFTSDENANQGYGVRENGTSPAVITLTNNNFTAANAVVMGKKTDVTAGTINVVSGTYVGNISKTAAATGKIVISGGKFSAPLADAQYAEFIADGLCGVNGLYEGDAPNGIGEAIATVTSGETVLKYASLEAAIAAAVDGSTVTLLKSTSGNGIKVPEGKYSTGLTVDFGGFIYTVDGTTVGSTGTETQAFQLLKDNKITFQNGTIYSEKAKMLVQNYSDLTLEGMTLTLDNANHTPAYTLSNNNGNVVIDGTTINANPAGGFAFDVCRYSSYPSVSVTVKGESVINGNIEVSASNNDPKDGFGLTLEAGTFNGNIVLDASAEAVLNATPEKAVIKKNNSLTTVAAPQDYKWVDNGDGTSTLAPCVYVAQIGDTKYESLAAAVAAVPADGTETTIEMIANEMINVVGSAITIPANKNVVIDLNGYQVVGTAAGGSTSALITNKGTLTIKDSSDTNKDGTGTGKLISGATETWIYNGDGNYAGSYASNTITNSGTLTIESGYVENLSTGSATYAVDNNSSGGNAILNVNGGLLKAHSVAVRQFANSTTLKNEVNVAGGTVTAGYSGIWIQLPGSDATKAMKASLNVTGGTLSGGTLAFYDYSYGNSFDATQYNLSGGTFNGDIFSYGANINITDGTYNGEVAVKQTKPSTVAVSGGKFGGDVYTYGDNASEGFITGGIFAINTYEYNGNTYDCDWLSLLAEGYIPTANTDSETKDAYPYTVRKANYICAIGTTKYETLAEAVAAAGTAETTITLLTEAATDGVISGDGVVVPSGSNITFDLNGLTYNVSGETVGSSGTKTSGFQLLKESNITFKNGTLKATSPTAQMLIQNYSNLTLEDVNLDGTALSGWAYALSNNCGTINLTGSTSITAKSGGRAFDTCKFGSYAIPTVNINTTGAITGPIEATGGKLNIENGKFNVTWVTDSHYTAGDIQITGGVFSDEPAEEYCADGYVVVDNEDEATKEDYPYTVMSKEDAGIFELKDWEPYPYKDDTADRNATSITYKRKFPSNNYNAWYVPFDYTITEEDLQNFDFYKFHMISASSSTGNANVNNVTAAYIHLQKITTPGTKLRGNSPYVIVLKNAVDETAVYEFKMEGDNLKLLKPNNNSAFQMMSADFDYDFFGTYDKYGASKPKEWFALNNGRLSPNNKAGASINQYRWVLKLTPRGENSDYSKISFGFIEDEDATGLSTIGADEDNQIEGIYSVNGSKHDNLEKGINIIRYKNGTTKKVIIK